MLILARPLFDRSTTGRLTISVIFATPLFSDIWWWIRLYFYVVYGQRGGFSFVKKCEFFCIWSRQGIGSAWFTGSAWFVTSSSSLLVFNFWPCTQTWAWTLPYVKSDIGNELFRLGLPCKMGFMAKSLIPTENLNLTGHPKKLPANLVRQPSVLTSNDATSWRTWPFQIMCATSATSVGRRKPRNIAGSEVTPHSKLKQINWLA